MQPNKKLPRYRFAVTLAMPSMEEPFVAKAVTVRGRLLAPLKRRSLFPMDLPQRIMPIRSTTCAYKG